MDSLGRSSRMYFDACIELPCDGVGFDGGLLATQTIAGGVHLTGAPVATHRALAPALDRLFDDPLLGQGLLIGDDRPAIIKYSRDAKRRAKGAWFAQSQHAAALGQPEPRTGRLTRASRGAGRIAQGAAQLASCSRGDPPMTTLDLARPFLPIRIAVLTVSDTRGLEHDTSGGVLVDRIAAPVTSLPRAIS